ncbi:hypothetical protein MTBLM1_120025 [Rhodospirillaceae bacterium LM-1]|nr:hypothetical protein MTBLM1_120025 [Rhodospirillaceae bacterium LM-1]
MSRSRLISFQEFEKDWLPTCLRIFPSVVLEECGEGSEVLQFHRQGGFVDKAWQSVAIPEPFCEGFGWVTYAGPVCGMRRDGREDSEDKYDAFLRTLKERGVEEVCASTGESYASASGILDVSELYGREGGKIINLPVAVLYPLVVFSREADWGLLSMKWSQASILGGTAEFMEHYLRNAGGLDKVRQHFYDFDLWGWGYFDRPPDQWIADYVYELVGWEKPYYPPGSYGNYVLERDGNL